MSTFKCHWTAGELLTALLGAGLELLHVLEEPDTDPGFWLPEATDEDADLIDWRKNPRVGLPAWLTLVARKRGSFGLPKLPRRAFGFETDDLAGKAMR
jgi:hypothetical protein